MPRTGEALFQLVADRLDGPPTLTHEPEVTTRLRDQARTRVSEHFDTFTKGDVLVEQGQAIGEEQLILLRMEHEAAKAFSRLGDRVRRAIGILVLVAALFAADRLLHLLARAQDRSAISGTIAALCGLVVLCPRRGPPAGDQPWNAELVPVAIAAMILAIAYNPHFALDGHLRPLPPDLHGTGHAGSAISWS